MAEGKDRIIIDVLGNTRPLEKEIQRVASQSFNLNAKSFSAPLGKISGQLGEFEKSLAASNARVIAFGASAGAIYAVQKAFQETIKSVIDVEKALTDINVILNVSQKSLSEFGSGLFKIAKDTGTSFQEVTRAATEFSRQGLGVTDTLKRTSDALVLTRLSGLDVVSSVEAITAALNSFNQTSITSNELINKLAAVDASFAVSSGDLAEAIKRVGSSAQDAGVSLDQLVALVTSAQQTTSRGGAVIGNSFKTIFTRLERPKVLDSLDELGVKTRDIQGNALPLIQVLQDLSKTFDTLGGSQRAQISELVGGVFQINILKAALSDLSKEYSIYGQALEISTGSADEANQRNEALNQTLAATINKTLVNLQGAASQIGEVAFGPAIERALGGLNSVLENFSSSKDTESIGEKIGQSLLSGLGNFLSGPGLLLGLATTFKVFERLTVFAADAFKSLSSVSAQNTNQQALQTQILNLLGKNPQIIEQINKENLSTTTLHSQILSLIEKETAAMQQQVAIANSLAKSLAAVGVTVASAGIYKGAAISKNKALGFIPNFAASEEITGALMGGYSPGSIRKTSIPKYGQVTYNTAETVKKFDGFSQQAIMPPGQSPAGKAYKNNFQDIHGFNPYSSRGFVPNFAGPAEIVQKYKLKSLADAEAYRKPGTKSFEFGKDTKLSEAQIISVLNRTPKKTEGGVGPIKSDSTLLALKAGQGGGKQGYTFKPKNGPIVDVQFPVRAFNEDATDFKLTDLRKNLDSVIGESISMFAKKIYETRNINPPIDLPSTIEAARQKADGLSGSIEGTIGGIFESAFRSSFGDSVKASKKVLMGGRELPNFDVAKIPPGLAKFFVGDLPSGKPADFKNSDSPDNRRSMAIKILSRQSPSLYNSLSKTAAAQGFIPNFSPIKKALNAEKKLGGNGALDFEPGFGLYVRDKNTQKNFNDVKKDHPEGLDKAMRNSFAVQKNTAAFGFVPNFAPNLPTLSPQESAGNYEVAKKMSGSTPELDSSIKNLSNSLKQAAGSFNKLGSTAEKTSSEMQSQNLGTTVAQTDTKIRNLRDAFNDDKIKPGLQKFKQNLGFASIGISMAGGFLAETFGSDNAALKDGINGFSQGLSTATTAVMLIPGPAGLLVGAFTALYSAASTVAKYMKQNGEDLGQLLDKAKQDASEFSNSSQNFSQIQQKIRDAYTNPKTSSMEMDKLNKQLVDAAGDLPEKYRMQLLGIGDNIKLQEEMTRVQGELVKEQKNLQFASSYSAKLLESAFTTPNVFKSLSELDSAAKSIVDGFSKQGKTDFISGIESQAVNLTKSSKNEFIKYLKEFYGLNTSIAGALDKANPQEINNLKTALIKLGQSAKSNRDAVEAGIGSRKAEALKLELLKRAADEADAAVGQLNDSLMELISASIQGSEFNKQNVQNEAANQRSIELNRATGNLNLQSEFSTPESVNRAQSILGAQSRNEDTLRSFRDVVSDSRKDMGNAVQDLLKKLSSENSGLSASPEIIKKLGETYMNIGGKNLDPQKYADEIYKATVQLLGSNKTTATGLQDKLISINQNSNQKLLTISQEAIKNNKIAQDNLIIQQQMVQNKRDISAMGGLEGYASGGSYDKITQSLKDFKSTKGGGPSRASVLSETINLAGGGFNEKFLSGLTPFLNKLKSQRSEDIKSNALNLAKNAPRGIAPIFNDIAKRSYDIASKQVDAAIKSSQADAELGLNVKDILGILQKANLGQQRAAEQFNVPGTIGKAQEAIKRDYAAEYRAKEEELKRAQAWAANSRVYQGMGEDIGQKSSRITDMEQRKVQIKEQNESLLKQLEASNLPEQIKTFLLEQIKEALATGKQVPSIDTMKADYLEKNKSPINSKPYDVTGTLSELDFSKGLDQLKNLDIKSIIGDLSKNQADLQNTEASINGLSQALQKLNEDAIVLKKALEGAGQKPTDITSPIDSISRKLVGGSSQPQGDYKYPSGLTEKEIQALGQGLRDLVNQLKTEKQQQQQQQQKKNDQSSIIQLDTKPISLNIPENAINLQMGGNITVDPINFNVSLAQSTDLTSMISPIAEKIVTDINLALTASLQNQMTALKQQVADLGGRRMPPERIGYLA